MMINEIQCRSKCVNGNLAAVMATAVLCLVGCQTPSPPPPAPAPVPQVVEQKPQPPPQKRVRTQEQKQMLTDFAMRDAPDVFKVLQEMYGEMMESGKKIKRLREDLLEFDRNPDNDEDYNALVAGLRELARAYESIFDKLEEAFIAKKKFEAYPSRKDYQETMKRALEDGIQDATIATERYKEMTRQK